MKWFALSLDEDARVWFKSLNGVVKNWNGFKKLFFEQWETGKDGKMLLAKHHEIKEKENETMREFNMRFQKLMDRIPKRIKPRRCASIMEM